MRLPGGAADQSPPLSRSAQFRDQFRVLPRHRRHCTRGSSPRITGPATAPAKVTLLADAVRRRRQDHRRMVRGLRRGRRARSRSTAARCARASRLGDFAGQLFLHVVGAAGHDVVKYALDMFGETGGEPDGALSCTHDANAWPADRYAGLPAPAPGERVDPVGAEQPSDADPRRRDRAQPDGRGARRRARRADRRRSPAARSMSPSCCPISPGRGRSNCAPASMSCGRATRSSPASGRRIAHVNVERADLRPDPELPDLAPLLGKGYLLPAPILPGTEWESLLLPTPMALSQAELPIAALVYDRDGKRGRATAARPLAARPRDGADARRARGTSSAAVTAMSSWSTISPRRRRAATAGCTRCSAIATATAATPPRPASARMSSTRCWSIAASRNPIPARRRASRPGCSCGSATAATTRCAI